VFFYLVEIEAVER